MVHSAFYRGLEAAQTRLAASGRSLRERAAAATSLADELGRRSRSFPWACRAGCAHCCHHPVGLTAAEAVQLHAAIVLQPPHWRDVLERRIVAAAAATRDLPWLQLAGQPCPLLVDGQCAAYAARPLACRAWGSANADACAGNAAGTAVAVPFDRTTFGLGLGIGHALADANGHRELRSALAALFAAADADLQPDPPPAAGAADVVAVVRNDGAAIAAFATARCAGVGDSLAVATLPPPAPPPGLG